MLNANTTQVKILKVTVYYTDRNAFVNFEFLNFCARANGEASEGTTSDSLVDLFVCYVF